MTNGTFYQSRLISRNVRINGHRTSIRLEPELWNALEKVARCEGKSVNDLCSIIAGRNLSSSFTSAVRVYILTYYERKLSRLSAALATLGSRKAPEKSLLFS